MKYFYTRIIWYIIFVAIWYEKQDPIMAGYRWISQMIALIIDKWHASCETNKTCVYFLTQNPIKNMTVNWWPSTRHNIIVSAGVFGPDPHRDKTRPSELLRSQNTAEMKNTREKRKKKAKRHLPPPELPVLVFIHGESWSWGSARWITRIVAKPNPI